MSLPSFIKIIKVNEPRSGTKDGRAWVMQDAECVTLDENGELLQVGVLSLPKSMMGDKVPVCGTYTPVYGMQVGMRDRRIEPAIVGLTPYPTKGAPVAPATPKAPA